MSFTKKMIVVAIVAVITLIAIILLLFGGKKQNEIVLEAVDMNASIISSDFAEFENNATNALQQVTPPPLPNQMEFDDKEVSKVQNAQFNEPSNEAEKELNKLADEINGKIPDISEQTASLEKQAEAIKQIEKMQKPESMVEYLKEIQGDIIFRGYDNNFKYDMKIYYKGDKLNDWYEIEEITPNFIRFKDENYSYNLRFIK